MSKWFLCCEEDFCIAISCILYIYCPLIFLQRFKDKYSNSGKSDEQWKEIFHSFRWCSLHRSTLLHQDNKRQLIKPLNLSLQSFFALSLVVRHGFVNPFGLVLHWQPYLWAGKTKHLFCRFCWRNRILRHWYLLHWWYSCLKSLCQSFWQLLWLLFTKNYVKAYVKAGRTWCFNISLRFLGERSWCTRRKVIWPPCRFWFIRWWVRSDINDLWVGAHSVDDDGDYLMYIWRFESCLWYEIYELKCLYRPSQP